MLWKATGNFCVLGLWNTNKKSKNFLQKRGRYLGIYPDVCLFLSHKNFSVSGNRLVCCAIPSNGRECRICCKPAIRHRAGFSAFSSSAFLKRQTRHHPSDTGFSNNFRFRFWGFRALPKRAKTRAPEAHLHVSVGHRHQLSVHNVPGILKIIGASRQRHDPVGDLYRHR